MLPETLVTLIRTLDQSGSCCALADCPQTSTAPSNAETTPTPILPLISLLLRKTAEDSIIVIGGEESRLSVPYGLGLELAFERSLIEAEWTENRKRNCFGNDCNCLIQD